MHPCTIIIIMYNYYTCTELTLIPLVLVAEQRLGTVKALCRDIADLNVVS